LGLFYFYVGIVQPIRNVSYQCLSKDISFKSINLTITTFRRNTAMTTNLSTLGEVAEIVEQNAQTHRDQLVRSDDIHFVNLEQLVINGELHRVLPHAGRLISNRLGVPHQYLNRCPSGLQAKNLNHWLGEQEDEKEFFVRFENDAVRAVFSPRYKTIDNTDVLNRLDQLGFGPETEVHAQIDPNFMSLSLPDESKSFLVKRGDSIVPGLTISNSEIGLSSLKIEAFFLRLICTNGLIGKASVTSSFRHISKRVLDELPMILRNVSQEASIQAEQFKFSLESPVDHPVETFNSFNQKFLLDEQQKTALDWAWEFEGNAENVSMFHILNSYTKAAQFPDLPVQSQYKLQKVGGEILSMVHH
jgi:hypothetical protein